MNEREKRKEAAREGWEAIKFVARTLGAGNKREQRKEQAHWSRAGKASRNNPPDLALLQERHGTAHRPVFCKTLFCLSFFTTNYSRISFYLLVGTPQVFGSFKPFQSFLSPSKTMGR